MVDRGCARSDRSSRYLRDYDAAFSRRDFITCSGLSSASLDAESNASRPIDMFDPVICRLLAPDIFVAGQAEGKWTIRERGGKGCRSRAKGNMRPDVRSAKMTETGRRLRVAIYSPHFSEYSYRLAAGLARNCDVRLVLNRKDANQQWKLSAIPVPLGFETRIRDLSVRGRGGSGIPKSFLDVIAFRPDVVHCHEVPEYYTATLIEILRPFRIPLVLTVHDAAPHSEGGSGTNSIEERLRRRLRAADDLVTLHGESCIAEFRRVSGDCKARIKPAMHGVLMVPPQGAAPVQPLAGRILFFGRMFAYKGLDVFLDAMDILVKRGVQHQAVVAGRGPEMPRLGARMATIPTVEPIDASISPDATALPFQSAEVVALPYKDATQSSVLAASFGDHPTVRRD